MRPLAIELAFDPDSDQRLRELWSHLSTLYSGPLDSQLGVRPHVTWAVFRRANPRNAVAVGEALAKQLRTFRLDLATVDRFPGSEGVVFLRPAVSSELAHAHALAHELLAEERDLVDPYYRPNSWQAHCTMATNVPDAQMGTVLSACSCLEALGQVWVTRIQLVRYRLVIEVWSKELRETLGAV